MTKTEMRKIARRARQYGYFRKSDSAGYVFCPECRAEVAAPRFIDYAKGRWETWPVALDRAMLDHLDPASEECTAVVGTR